jgi:stress-induced morphogen
LNPSHLEIIDESHKHAGHAAMKDYMRSGETHFKVVVVSDDFEGKMLIDRHRLVNDILDEELQNGVHALSIEAKTPAQWEMKLKNV